MLIEGYGLNVWERSLGKDGLSDNTRESKHGQTAVGELTHLHLLHLLFRLVVQKFERVETEVTRLTTGSPQHLHDSHSADDLCKGDPEENLSHSSSLDKCIVRGDRGKSLVCFWEWIDLESHIHSNESNVSQHANTAMLQLCLAKEVHWDKIGEAEWVETGLIANISLQVFGVWKERESSALFSTERGCASCRRDAMR